MKKYVFIVKDDVCQANGKDPSAIALITKMTEYGEVVPYEDEFEVVKNEYQCVIDNLTAELNSIKVQKLDGAEIELVATHRKIKQALVAQEEAKVKALEAQVKTMRDKNELIVRQATAALEQIAKQ